MSGHDKTSQGLQRVNGRRISGVLFWSTAHTPTSKTEGLCPQLKYPPPPPKLTTSQKKNCLRLFYAIPVLHTGKWACKVKKTPVVTHSPLFALEIFHTLLCT